MSDGKFRSLAMRNHAAQQTADGLTERFLTALRPLLVRNRAVSAWLVGSHATGTAGPESDIDVIVVAPSDRSPVERGKDYLPALLAAGRGVDIFVYTPAEFERLMAEERPFLVHALSSAKPITWTRPSEVAADVG